MKIGITFSCFDLLHAGHIAMLREAKLSCDHLIVGLQLDPSIERPQKNKPVQSLVERYMQIEAVRFVDQVIPYNTEQDLLDILYMIRPDIRFIGDEYKTKEYTGKNLTPTTHYNKRLHGYSSSELRNRIKGT